MNRRVTRLLVPTRKGCAEKTARFSAMVANRPATDRFMSSKASMARRRPSQRLSQRATSGTPMVAKRGMKSVAT